MTVIDLNHGDVEPTQRELPNGWRWARLGEISTINPQKPSNFTRDPDALTTFVPMAAVDAELGQIIEAEYKPFAEVERGYTYFAEGDILFAKITPCMQNKKSAIARGLIDGVGFGTTEFHVIRPGNSVLAEWIYYQVRESRFLALAEANFTGAVGQQRVPASFLAQFTIPLPPVEEQREIAWQLERDMDKVERLRAEALRQRKAVEALPSAYLRDAFAGIEAQVWNWERLGDVCTLLPSKSIATEADTEVLAITTACLSEHGFQQSGLKKARMWANDVSECTVIPGEILVARSNTAELVGRATLFSGEVDNVVASDLTIRLWPGPLIFPPFLATYLSFLYQSGYWKERAGGASDSMKKITRSQILRMHIPLPSLDEQNTLVQQFEHNMTVVAQLLEAAQRNLASVEALPNVLLREVFGDFTS